MNRKSYNNIKSQSIRTAVGVFEYSLCRSAKRRTLQITVSDDSCVRVYAPYCIPEKEIRRFINEKAQWIVANLRKSQETSASSRKHHYYQGERFLFLGNTYPLYFHADGRTRSIIVFDGQQWCVTVPFERIGPHTYQKEIKKVLCQWYRVQAREILGCRVFYCSRIMGHEPLTVGVRTQRRIWGSCSTNKKAIHLNWQLIMAPMDVIDYVIVHELTHLKIPNHSKRFWGEVKKVMPGYKIQQQWLKTHRLEMRLP